MAYKLGDTEYADRAKVAKELGRQDFWKDSVVAALRYTGNIFTAIEQANKALDAFDVKFGGAP